MNSVLAPGRRAPLAAVCLAVIAPSSMPALASAQPLPSIEVAPPPMVHFEGQRAGYSLRRWRLGQPATALCELPCDLRPTEVSRLALRHPDGSDVPFPGSVQFRAGDSVRLRYASHTGRRVAGYVTGGLVVAAWITTLTLLAVNGVDLSFGTSGSHANPLGFLYGFVIGATLAPSIVLAATTDGVEFDVSRGPNHRPAEAPQGAMLRFSARF
jgi:hypothetical protein